MIETYSVMCPPSASLPVKDRSESFCKHPRAPEHLFDRQNLWIVIPAFNESESLPAVLNDLKSHGYRQLLVVDDGSTDDTHVAAVDANVWVIRHAVNRGQGAALQTGIDFAIRHQAEMIVTFDADGQHDPRDIEAMIRPLLDDEVDVVLGSRFLGTADRIPWSRKMLLKLAVLLTRVTTRLRLTDTHNGLRAFRANATPKLRLAEDGMAHASEFLRHLSDSKLRFREIPVTIRYTSQSLSKGQTNRAAIGIAFRMLIGRLVR